MKEYKEFLKYHNYLKIAVGSALSRFGDGVDTIAFSLLVYRITGSAVLVASLFAVNGLPNILFGLVSGVVSTHREERKIMAFCDFGRMFIGFSVAVLFLNKNLEVWHLYIATFCNSSLEAFRGPASTSIFPKLIDEQFINGGIALKSSAERFCEVLGLACAASVIKFMGIHTALLIDAGTFFISGVLTYFVHVEKTERNAVTIKSGFLEIIDGLNYVKKDRTALFICIFTGIINIVFVPINAFQAPYVEAELKGTEAMLSLIGVSAILSMAFSTPFCVKIQNKIKNGGSLQLGGGCIAISYIILSVLKYTSAIYQYIGLIISMVLLGFGIALANYILQSIFYEFVPEGYLARMGAIMSTAALCAMPITSAVLGIVLNYVDISFLFLIFSVLTMIIFLFSKKQEFILGS